MCIGHVICLQYVVYGGWDGAADGSMFKGIDFKDPKDDKVLWSIQLEDNLDNDNQPANLKTFQKLVLKGNAVSHTFFRERGQDVITGFKAIVDADGEPAMDFSPNRIVARNFHANGVKDTTANGDLAFTGFVIRTGKITTK